MEVHVNGAAYDHKRQSQRKKMAERQDIKMFSAIITSIKKVFLGHANDMLPTAKGRDGQNRQ